MNNKKLQKGSLDPFLQFSQSLDFIFISFLSKVTKIALINQNGNRKKKDVIELHNQKPKSSEIEFEKGVE